MQSGLCAYFCSIFTISQRQKQQTEAKQSVEQAVKLVQNRHILDNFCSRRATMLPLWGAVAQRSQPEGLWFSPTSVGFPQVL